MRIAIIVLVLTTGCQHYVSRASIGPRPSIQATTHDWASVRLKDPDSARFHAWNGPYPGYVKGWFMTVMAYPEVHRLWKKSPLPSAEITLQ